MIVLFKGMQASITSTAGLIPVYLCSNFTTLCLKACHVNVILSETKITWHFIIEKKQKTFSNKHQWWIKNPQIVKKERQKCIHGHRYREMHDLDFVKGALCRTSFNFVRCSKCAVINDSILCSRSITTLLVPISKPAVEACKVKFNGLRANVSIYNIWSEMPYFDS